MKENLDKQNNPDVSSREIEESEQSIGDTQESSHDILNRAGKLLSLGQGNVEFGVDDLGFESIRCKFSDFEYYTIDPREVEWLKSIIDAHKEHSHNH